MKRGPVNWNRELIWKMRTELEYQWDLLEETILTSFEDLLDTVKRHFREVESLLESMSIDPVPQLMYGRLWNFSRPRVLSSGYRQHWPQDSRY